jgi:hypothetical protein
MGIRYTNNGYESKVKRGLSGGDKDEKKRKEAKHGKRGSVVAEMESRRPYDTDDRRDPFSDRVDVVPTFPLGMTNMAREPSWVGGRHFVPRGLV